MAYRAPGRHTRIGISWGKMFHMFPDDKTAEKWFMENRWPDGVTCVRCGSMNVNTKEKHKTMPYRCRDCKKKFSVPVDTVTQSSKLGYQIWIFAYYLLVTSLKGVSSMKLHRDLGITQKSAWYLAHRIRESWSTETAKCFMGPVEADESFFGGKESNKHPSRKLHAGGGTVGKTAAVGVKDRETNQVRAKVVVHTDKETLQGFVKDNTYDNAFIYTDEAHAYRGLLHHKSAKHSAGEYVNDQIHTNGMESFWAVMKRGFYGTYHRMSRKHLQRYVYEFAGRFNSRSKDTLDQLIDMALEMEGKRLKYVDLIARASINRTPTSAPMSAYCTATEDDDLPF